MHTLLCSCLRLHAVSPISPGTNEVTPQQRGQGTLAHICWTHTPFTFLYLEPPRQDRASFWFANRQLRHPLGESLGVSHPLLWCDPGQPLGSSGFFRSSLPALVPETWRCIKHTDTKQPVETNRFTLSFEERVLQLLS